MKKFLWILLFYASLLSADARDDEMFGEQASETPSAKELKDTTSVGGRLEINTSKQQFEGTSFKQSQHSQSSSLYTFFDARPNDEVRGFARFKFQKSTALDLKMDLDEAWIKTSIQKKYFLTYGIQHVKWGVGKFWNPSDFLASAVKDPLATYDKRLGSEMFKLHFPIEKDGSNLYLISNFDNFQLYPDPGLALRAEFMSKSSEYSFSAYTRTRQPLKLAADISSALGEFDVYSELVLSTQNRRLFYKGNGDLVTGQGFSVFERKQEWIPQWLAGLSYSHKYNDKDSFIIGTEYFYNDLGYDRRELELLSFVRGQSDFLYLAKHYAGLYLLFPQLGSWTESSLYFNTLANISDSSLLSRLSFQSRVNREVLVEVWSSASFGALGEFRFSLPAALSSQVNKNQDSALTLARGVSRALGFAASMKF